MPRQRRNQAVTLQKTPTRGGVTHAHLAHDEPAVNNHIQCIRVLRRVQPIQPTRHESDGRQVATLLGQCRPMRRNINAHRTARNHRVPAARQLGGEVGRRLCTVDARVTRTNQRHARGRRHIQQVPRIASAPQPVRSSRPQIVQLRRPQRIGGSDQPRPAGCRHVRLRVQGAFHAAVPAQAAGRERLAELIAAHLMLTRRVVAIRATEQGGLPFRGCAHRVQIIAELRIRFAVLPGVRIGDVPGQQVVQGQRRSQGGEGFDHELIGGFGVAHQLGGAAADVLAARRLKLLRAEGGVEQGRWIEQRHRVRTAGGCTRRRFGVLTLWHLALLFLPRLLFPAQVLQVHLFQVHRVQAGGEETRQPRRVIGAR